MPEGCNLNNAIDRCVQAANPVDLGRIVQMFAAFAGSDKSEAACYELLGQIMGDDTTNPSSPASNVNC